jgi:hypothetical protein
MIYVCRTKCFWNGRLYEVGDTAEVDSAVIPPEHFIRVGGEVVEEKPKAVKEQKAEPEPTKPKRGRTAKAK